jgi:site-specific recombinase XerC
VGVNTFLYGRQCETYEIAIVLINSLCLRRASETRSSKSLCFSAPFTLEKNMHHLIDEYLNYLRVEKGASRNTIDGYSRDLGRYAGFVGEGGTRGIGKIGTEDLISFLASLQKEGLAAISVNRALAAIRGFYKYLLREKKVEQTPVAHIELARVWMRLPDVLSREEMERLLAQPGAATPSHCRDSAMLELVYATGIRVSELIGLTINSINWQVGYLVAMGKGEKERIVPVGRTAYDRVKHYLEGARPLSEPFGERINTAGVLEDREKVCCEGRPGQEGSSAYFPSLLRLAPAGGRGGSAFRTDHAGSCRHLDNADLHARNAGTPEGDPPEVSSPWVKGFFGGNMDARKKSPLPTNRMIRSRRGVRVYGISVG